MFKKLKVFLGLLPKEPKPVSFDELLVLSKHWDGHTRESAVRELGDRDNSSAIPSLIERCNDWVPQVRSAAKESLLKLAVTKNTLPFVRNLPKLYHLRKCQREDHSSLIQSIETYLVTTENGSCFLRGRNLYCPPVVASISMDFIIKHNLMSDYEIACACIKDSRSIIRVKILAVLDKLNGKNQEVILKDVIKDSLMPVRREAFQIMLRNTKQLELAESFLLDPSASIREIAMLSLKNSSVDVEDFYLKALESNFINTIRSGIWGLKVLKSTRYLRNIQEFLKHPSANVRQEALWACVDLDKEESQKYVLQALSDDAPIVYKAAMKIIKSDDVDFDITNLSSLSSTATNPILFRNCVFLSKRLNKWDQILFLLSSLKNKKESTDILKDAIHFWVMKLILAICKLRHNN